MKINSQIAAALLIASGVVAAQAFAQAPSRVVEAQRLAKLKAQRDAAIAAAKAQNNTINRPTQPIPTATPTTTPTNVTINRPTQPIPTATPTTTPTTVTPTASASAAPKGSASASAFAGGAPSAVVVLKPPPVLGLDLEELKKTRPERRKAEVTGLQARWGGELLRNDKAATELKQHAQRTAYLQRIRSLASQANDAKTVLAVDQLITKEDLRNADAMNALRSGALPAPIAGGAK